MIQRDQQNLIRPSSLTGITASVLLKRVEKLGTAYLYLAETTKHSQEKILCSSATIHQPQVKVKQAMSRQVGQSLVNFLTMKMFFQTINTGG